MSDKPQIITVVRHGETEWNAKGIQQGHLNSGLTSEGVRQAKILARHLKGKNYEVIHASSLGRALETAGIINRKLKLEIIQEDGLRERNLGIMQGLTIDEFRIKFPEEHEKFISGDPDYMIPGGESVNQKSGRTIACMEKIVRESPYSKILVVCHGGNLDSLFKHVLGIPLNKKRNFSIFNSSLNTFLYENGRWQLLTWGDISPLKNLNVLDDF
jgi:2,3-bisphosphoglycerate-dependent phosphoglycerate mutase